MRVEYAFGLDKVDIPYFSVESMEGPEKLFRLVTLVMNVLHIRPRVDVIFHSPNKDDLPKIEEKLKSGLPDDTSSAADAAKTKKVGNGG